MVEEMKYVGIAGPVDRLDWVIEHYIAKYDIHLEYAARKLHHIEGLRSFTGVNPYVEVLHKAERFLKILGPQPDAHYPMTGERAVRIVESAHQVFERRDIRLKELEYRRDSITDYINHMRYFSSLDFDLQAMEEFSHISYAFGRLPVSNFRQFEKFMYDDSEILFIQSHSDRDYIWGVYFTPRPSREKVDSVFASLHFERVNLTSHWLGEQLSGSPAAIIVYWQNALNDLNSRIERLTETTFDTISANKTELVDACAKIKELYYIFDIKKHAAHTNEDYYVFVGWMTRKDALAFEKEVDADEMTIISLAGEISEQLKEDIPPTYLKNPPVIRLFEFFTRMYGIPLYGEIDPTPIIAVIYTLLFGLMFGDVGQGLCIALLGFYVYKRFKTDLGGIMSVMGVSSTVFGFLYGSVFGFEDILTPLWRQPAEDMNGTLLFSVGVGVVIIFISMLINIINAVRQKHWSQLLFSPNGIAGMLFYGGVLLLVLRVLVYGQPLTGLSILLVTWPLLVVAFREPLTKYMEGEHHLIDGGIGMFLFSTVIDLYEVLLTYVTNTLSFIRVGAFALSHAGIMGVVLLLSQSAAGTHNPIVIILGNLIVIGIEGLLVGIQVLRLDFYELFSRFYDGGGQAFQSYRPKRT